MSRAARAASMAPNGRPGSRGSGTRSATARRSASPNASAAVTRYPARAADAASARVATPAISTWPRSDTIEAQSPARRGQGDDEQMIQHRPFRLPDPEPIDQRAVTAARQSVGHDGRALGTLLGRRGETLE